MLEAVYEIGSQKIFMILQIKMSYLLTKTNNFYPSIKNISGELVICFF